MEGKIAVVFSKKLNASARWKILMDIFKCIPDIILIDANGRIDAKKEKADFVIFFSNDYLKDMEKIVLLSEDIVICYGNIEVLFEKYRR